MSFRRFLRLAGAAVLSLCAILTAVWLALAIQIVHYSYQVSNQPAQAAVVLGAAVWGKHPSPVYRERLNAAIRLYQQGRVDTLVFTGGTPELGYPAEADVARAYGMQQGVPGERILVENKSRSTYENLLQARELLRGAGLHTVLLVSDPLHMQRAMQIAHDLGIDAQPAPSDSGRVQSCSNRAGFLWRETWAMVEYWLHWVGHGDAAGPHPQTGELGRVNTNSNHGDFIGQSRTWRLRPNNSPPLSTACPGSVATSA